MALSQAAAERIGKAKTSESGNRIKEGSYVLIVKKITCSTKFSGTFYIPEFDVVAAEKTGANEPNKEGTDCSCAWDMNGKGKSGEAAKGNIKQFVAALLGIPVEDEDQITAECGKYAGETEKDPDCFRARGMLIECETRRQRIQSGPNAGTEGVFPRFKHVEQTEEEIAERRKDLDNRKR